MHLLRTAASTLVALASALALFAPDARAQRPTDEVVNLIVNGDFATDLSSWKEEGDDELTSNWSSADAAGDANSGSFRGEAKGGHTWPSSWNTHGTVGWQCFPVEPNRMYHMSVSANLDSQSTTRGTLYVQDIAGSNCPSGTHTGELPPSGSSSVAIFSSDGSGWNSRGRDVLIGAEQDFVRAGLHVRLGEVNAQGGYNAEVWFDDVVVGKIRPDILVELGASDTVVGPGDETNIRLTLRSAYNGIGPEVRAYHDGRLSLAGSNCPGTVVDASQGGQHYFLWSGIPDDPDSYSRSCEITARAATGWAGDFTVRAEADCAECDIETRRDNNKAALAMRVTAAPDLAVHAFDFADFPTPGTVAFLEIELRNGGTSLANGTVNVTTSPTLPFITSEIGNCANFQQFPGGTVTGQVLVAAGGTVSCTLGFQVPAEFEASALDGAMLAMISGDYDESNNNADAQTRIVRLRVNRVYDGGDRSPGDGICETQLDAGDCTLRAAVMEGLALLPITGKRQTVELPYSAFSYNLTRNSGDDESLFGDIDINRSITILGEPDASDNLPLVVAAFPTSDTDRIFEVDASTSSHVRIENLRLGGQGYAPSYTDGTDGDGGLVWHGGGDLTLANVEMRNGRSEGMGGALFSNGAGDLTLERVLVADNSADIGGGIALSGDGFAFVSVRDSRITGNSADTSAGGMINALSTALVGIFGTTIDDNEALIGGGLMIGDSPFTRMLNSTVSGNRAGSLGGGMVVVNSDVPIAYSTIAHNQVSPEDPNSGEGGGILVQNASVSLYSSILTYNTAKRQCSQPNPQLPPICFEISANCDGTLQSLGYNAAAGDSECSIPPATGDYAGNVSLAALADNGGPAPTHAPASTTQIVDVGDPSCLDGPGGNPVAVDQRGAARPADGNASGGAECDRGAYELSDSARISAVLSGAGSGRVVSSPAGVFCTEANPGGCEGLFVFGAEVTLTATADSGNEFVGWVGDCAGFGNDPCVLDAAGELVAEALFEPLSSSRTLFVKLVDGEGGTSGRVQSSPSGIDCPGSCSADFALGEDVVLSATPDADAVFLGFFGAGCNGTTGDCTVSMDASRYVDAVFDAERSSIAVTLTGGGVGQVTSSPAGVNCPGTCSSDFSVFDAVTLNASAAVGSRFGGWSGACTGTGPCQLDMDLGPHAVEAEFIIDADHLFGDGFE